MLTSIRNAVLAGAFAFAIVAPARAEAQFGGLMKKAKEAVVQKGAEKGAEQAGEKMGPVTPGEQLTEELLGQVLRGAQAADRVMGERDRVQALRESKNKQYSELADKNQPIHRAYDEANSKILDCRSTSFNNLREARDERIKKRTDALEADPAFMGKMQLVALKYGKAMADAQQKNDPVALQKVQADYFKELLGTDVFADVKADSIATDGKCGKVPAKPAALAQEEKLQKDVSVADDSIRTLEAKAVNVGAQSSGLEQVRYLALKERALGILNKVSSGNGAKFGEAEVEAVKKRKDDLDKVKRAL
ncbi:MAG: hypothetical protein ABIY52_15820 [Gemmatimonadaceae bacterium]